MIQKVLSNKRNISVLIVIGLLISSISLSTFIEKKFSKKSTPSYARR